MYAIHVFAIRTFVNNTVQKNNFIMNYNYLQ